MLTYAASAASVGVSCRTNNETSHGMQEIALPPRPIRFLSFGAGVQSSYLARAILNGDIEPVDHVVFADTGDEPDDVYRNLEWWKERFARNGIPFHIVRPTRPISEQIYDAIEGRSKAVPIPVFVKREDGGSGLAPRQCTSSYKLAPIRKLIREIVGVQGRRHTHITDHLALHR